MKTYEPLLSALAELMKPLLEIAVHDLKKGKITALYNNLSRRKVGDPSPLHELKVKLEDFPDIFPPYFKQNWDGRTLKCTSITLRDAQGRPTELICLNFDAGFFEEGMRFFQAFMGAKSEGNPIEIHGSPCAEQIDSAVEQYLSDKKLSFRHLKREEKKALVLHLYSKGLFNFKNAPQLIAQKLSLSKASVYNYIRS